MSKAIKFLIPLMLIAVFMVSYAAIADSTQQSESTSISSSTGDHNSTGDQSNTSDHNGTTDQQENSDHTQVQANFNENGKSIQFQSENHFNGTSTSLEVEISANDGLAVNFVYSGHSINQTENHLQIKLKLTKLVEFIDNKTSGIQNAYDLNDTLVKSYDLTTANWTLTVSNSTVSNNTVWTMYASTIINTNATLAVKFLFTDGFAQLTGNNTLAPNLVKFNVYIENYTYSSPQSQLALKTIFQSSLHSDQISNQTEDHTDGFTHNKESAVNFGNGSTDGFFSWADNYTVDGVNKQIVTSPSVSVDREDNSYNQLYFSFAQGTNITWDPKIGVTRATTFAYDIMQSLSANSSALSSLSSASMNTPGFELLMAVLSIGAITIVTRRYYKH